MAVYTAVSRSDLEAFLSTYDLGTLVEYEGINEGVENTNYRVETTFGKFILTLFEKRVNPKDLPYFLGLMDHLAKAQLPVPAVYKNRGGIALNQLNGRPVCVSRFLQGSPLESIHKGHCKTIGRFLAKMHLAGQGYESHRRNALDAVGWKHLANQIADIDRIQPSQQSFVKNQIEEITAEWPEDLPKAHIHADLFPDNVLFADDLVTGAIDFYFSAYDMRAYDLAVTLNAWCFDSNGNYCKGFGTALIHGYENSNPLTNLEREYFPLLCRGAALRFYLTRLYDWYMTPIDATVTKKDPTPYKEQLLFHSQISHIDAYA